MRTIFITSFHPLISRNILLPLFPYLTEEKDLRVAIFVPQKKWNYFSGVFGKKNVALEAICIKLSFLERFMRYFSLAALNTATLKIKRRTEMRGSGAMLSRLIVGKKSNQKFLRHFSYLFTPAGNLKKLFKKYKPDAVFATDIQNEFDLRLLHEAQRRGIKTIGMIRSWDNPTSKGLLRCIPDMLLAQNEIIKQELETLHGVPAEKISVIGIPHYDNYVKPINLSRDAFFENIGGDKSKKMILFAPIGDRYISRNSTDEEILRILDKSLPQDVQILVRLPPTDTVSGLENRTRENRLIFDRPANPFRTPKKAEISYKAEAHLKASVYYSNLVIAGPSTIAVDGVFFGKPVILVGFDGKERRSYYESVRRYYDYNHWEPILKSGGVKLAEDNESFKRYLKEYLENQELDERGRDRIVHEQVCYTDGKSTKRLANFLFSML